MTPLRNSPSLDRKVRTEAEALADRMALARVYAETAADIGPRMAMVERAEYYERTFRTIIRILEGK